VQKLSRLLLLLAGTALVLTAIVLLSVNLYVQSQGTQARIQQELRQRLGTTLNIRRISVTPWGGLKLSGISIPQDSGAGSLNFLEAKSLGLRVEFLSLFSRQLTIKQVSLVDPTVIWPQNGNGKWRLPGLREEERENAPIARAEREKLPAQPEIARPAPAPKPDKRPDAGSPVKDKASAFVPEVRRVNLVGGSFRFLDRSGNMVAAFEGVEFRSSVRNAVALRGNARVAKVSLRDRFFLEELKSPLQYDPTNLELSQISAHVGGGDVMGHFSMQPQMEESPFTVDVKFRNVEADQVVTEAGGPKDVVHGKLEGSFQAAGKTADPNAFTGAGEIFLRDGQVRQYSLLVAVGQVLQIDELTQLHLEQAEAKYHISPGVVTVDELILRSTNIRLSATGTITFGGKLRLESRLAINEKIRGQLFKPIRANFQPTEEPGYSAVDFEVGGTVERPKTNLLEKVVGRDLKDLVNSFWGGKSDRPKKKKSPETAPEESGLSPSPTMTPEPIQPAATATPASSP
jgi:AsmA-like C-terminal region/AsmA family